MKTKLLRSLVVLLGMVCGTVFTGCSNDDDEIGANKAVAFNFVLRFEDATGAGEDQPNLINTTYSFVNHRGEEESNQFLDEFVENQEIKSQNYTTLPGEVEIVVTETLKPDVELTKSSYVLGLKWVLQATSYAEDGSVVDFKEYRDDTSFAVSAAALSRIYPKTTRLKFKVSKDGTVAM